MKNFYPLKHLFFLCFLLIFSGVLSAQTINNVKYEYSCPCRVTVTYDLAKNGDVVLYYSTDNLNWLSADTFPAKTAGTHIVDIWDCEADSVLYGVFYYKLERLPTCEFSMIFVKGGTYTIGAATQSNTEGNTNPAITNSHAVTLRSFYMSETQVTQAQFTAVMGTNPSEYQSSTNSVYAPSRCKPVEKVNWYQAIAFCNKLSLMEGKTQVYSVSGITDWATLPYSSIPTTSDANWNAATMDMSVNGYRLPTEAEWEYAARGGNRSLTALGGLLGDFYYSGSNTANEVGWYNSNNGTYGTATYGTKWVGEKLPNALNLYDMSGNVFEWCWDWFANYTAGAVINPTGPASGTARVVRGGYWYSIPTELRVSNHGGNIPNNRSANYGFRLACTPDCPAGSVKINGVCWATRNLAGPGEFVENPEDYGALFQWGRRGDGHEQRTSQGYPTNDNIPENGVVSGASSFDADDQIVSTHPAYGKFIKTNIIPNDWRSPSISELWNSGTDAVPVKTVNDPSPAGYRVPTHAEIQSLLNLTYVEREWTTENGVVGMRFTDKKNSNSIFLPAAGVRDNTNPIVFMTEFGFYWSSIEYFHSSGINNAFCLQILNGNLSDNHSTLKGRGQSIRPVGE